MVDNDWRPSKDENVGTQYWSDGGVERHQVRVGSLYGARSFHATEDGHLSGVVFKQPWQPGPNRAKCWQRTGYGGIQGGGHPRPVLIPESETPPTKYENFVWDPAKKVHVYRRDMNANEVTPAWEPMRRLWVVVKGGETTYFDEEPARDFGNSDDEAHTPAGCKCGFHGYLRGSMDYAKYSDAVSGVVRAWGTLVLGERGFRAQFAEIVALYIPTPGGDSAGGFSVDRQKTPWAWMKGTALSEGLVGRVLQRYRVPYFTSLDAMLSEFPTTPPRDDVGGD